MSSRWQKLSERWRALPALARVPIAVSTGAILSFSTFHFLRGSSAVLWLSLGTLASVALIVVVL